MIKVIFSVYVIRFIELDTVSKIWNTNDTISDISRINCSKASTSSRREQQRPAICGNKCGIIQNQLRQRLLGCRGFERVNAVDARAIIALYTFVRTDTTYR